MHVSQLRHNNSMQALNGTDGFTGHPQYFLDFPSNAIWMDALKASSVADYSPLPSTPSLVSELTLQSDCQD